MNRYRRRWLLMVAIAFCYQGLFSFGEDWPMWRFGPQRSAATPEELPPTLTLLWRNQSTPRKQTWDDPLNSDLMTFDRLFEPILVGDRLYIGYNDRDKVSALDLSTGERVWDFFAEGPVRLPPASADGKIYFTSDDGFLYCLDASDGSLRWRFRGGPSSQQAIGNQRMISAWPARGGPVVREGRVYFAASIWPFMGVFLYCLDAKTGEVIWLNDETGAQYIKQPHSAPSFAGIAPQGALVATKDALIVPGGRSVPAVFDRATGKQRYFELNAAGKGTGGAFVAASESFFYVHTRLKGTRQFSLDRGVKTAFLPNEPVISGSTIYAADVEKEIPIVAAWTEDGKKEWEIEADGRGDLILAGKTLYAVGPQDREHADKNPEISPKSILTAIRLPENRGAPKILWKETLEGTVERLIAGNGKLVAISLEGSIAILGSSSPATPPKQKQTVVQSPSERSKGTMLTAEKAKAVLASGEATGYALWYGSEDRNLLDAIAETERFHQIDVIDPDASRVQRLRKEWDDRGWYGLRGAVHHAAPKDFHAPPYVAHRVFVSEEYCTIDSLNRDRFASYFRSVRPYGGVLQLLAKKDQIAELAQHVREMNLEQATVETDDQSVLVRRLGPLPGSSDWTHQHGNIANTIKSDDRLVKLPLGILWFGGNSNTDVLPRHGHGPPEQVVGGRLIIEGMNSLTARDVYTGRVLWKRTFKDLGTFDVFYDSTYADTPLDPAYNQVHIPGANGRGTNYVVTEEFIYLVEGPRCHVLKTSTGESVREISLPSSNANQSPEWGFIGVYEDILIGGVGFAQYRSRLDLTDPKDAELSKSKAGFGSKSLDRAASMALIGFDRHTGQELWKVDAVHSFWHNGIVAGNGKIFALDRNPKGVEDAMKRRGRSLPSTYRIVAFDAKTGEKRWQANEGIFGTWLGFSQKHDMLLQAGAAASDRLTSEVGQGMTVYRGSDGEVVWTKDKLAYSGPCILHNDWIITNANSYTDSAGAFYLLDGRQKMVKNPLTGSLQPWKITRAYGCNTISASENLLTFRSGAAGYYDLLTESGTGNLGGFRSGCTSNLVAANGILNAPDYTRTCSCSYQNQSSLGLVHMPELETWTIDNSAILPKESERILQLGINLGAPGDRRDGGVPWLEYPVIAGDSPNLGIEVTGDTTYYQDHPMTMSSASRPWISASGVEGLSGIRVSLKAIRPWKLTQGLPVESAEDDAEEGEDGTVDIGSSDLELVQDKSEQRIGIRFRKINLASSSEIRSAFLQFTAHAENDEETSLTIHAESDGNASPFREKKEDIRSRKLVSERVEWKPDAWKKVGESGTLQRTPDLSKLVKQVLEHPDWKPGNAIVFILEGKGKRVATAFAGGKEGAVKLVVDADEVEPPRETSTEKSKYQVRLFFGFPKSVTTDPRVFDVSFDGESTKHRIELDPKTNAEQVFTFGPLLLNDWLGLQFDQAVGKTILSGIEIQRMDG